MIHVDNPRLNEELGHSTITLTADTYTSVLPELAHSAAERIAHLIPRGPAWSALGSLNSGRGQQGAQCSS